MAATDDGRRHGKIAGRRDPAGEACHRPADIAHSTALRQVGSRRRSAPRAVERPSRARAYDAPSQPALRPAGRGGRAPRTIPPRARAVRAARTPDSCGRTESVPSRRWRTINALTRAREALTNYSPTRPRPPATRTPPCRRAVGAHAMPAGAAAARRPHPGRVPRRPTYALAPAGARPTSRPTSRRRPELIARAASARALRMLGAAPPFAQRRGVTSPSAPARANERRLVCFRRAGHAPLSPCAVADAPAGSPRRGCSIVISATAPFELNDRFTTGATTASRPALAFACCLATRTRGIPARLCPSQRSGQRTACGARLAQACRTPRSPSGRRLDHDGHARAHWLRHGGWVPPRVTSVTAAQVPRRDGSASRCRRRAGSRSRRRGS